MKKYILNAIAIFTFATGLSSCGDSFLETDNYKGVDLEGGLNTVTNVSTASVSYTHLTLPTICSV